MNHYDILAALNNLDVIGRDRQRSLPSHDEMCGVLMELSSTELMVVFNRKLGAQHRRGFRQVILEQQPDQKWHLAGETFLPHPEVTISRNGAHLNHTAPTRTSGIHYQRDDNQQSRAVLAGLMSLWGHRF